MTYRTNDAIEAGEADHLKHIRELCDAKIASNDDANALQLARDVLNHLGPAPAQLSPAQDMPTEGSTGI